MAKKYVYYFGDGKAEGTSNMKELLGGKGAGLAEMTNLGISVPPGFTISTEACVEYYKLGKKYPSGMWEASLQALKRVERSMGMGFGDPERPLLVSVRSGARASMPGMMDTVLNVGLTTKTVEGLAAKTRNDRFAQDSHRRFVSMFGSIVMGVPREHFEAILKHKKTEVGVTHETHSLTHHGGRPEALSELKKIEEVQFQALAGLLRGLKDSKEGGETLLDRTMVLYGSCMGNANSHANTNLPVLLAGGGFKHGRHLAFSREKNYPLPNLFVSMLQRLGLEADKFATSTGTMTGLEMAG